MCDDRFGVLVSFLLQEMPALIPGWGKSVQPFRVISEECGKKVEKEEVLLSATGPPTDPSSFFPPDTPPVLSSDNSWDSQRHRDSLSGKLCLSTNTLYTEEGMWRETYKTLVGFLHAFLLCRLRGGGESVDMH